VQQGSAAQAACADLSAMCTATVLRRQRLGTARCVRPKQFGLTQAGKRGAGSRRRSAVRSEAGTLTLVAGPRSTCRLGVARQRRQRFRGILVRQIRRGGPQLQVAGATSGVRAATAHNLSMYRYIDYTGLHWHQHLERWMQGLGVQHLGDKGAQPPGLVAGLAGLRREQRRRLLRRQRRQPHPLVLQGEQRYV
jgi:hypothetical protein